MHVPAVGDDAAGRRPRLRARPARRWRTPGRRACATAGTPRSRRAAASSTSSVGARAARRPQRPRPAAVRAAGEHARRTAARRWRGVRPGCRGDIALAQRQALAVFEPAQFFGPVARDLAVRADRQRHAGGQPAAAGRTGRRRGWPRCSGRARRRRRWRPRRRSRRASACVACTSCQRASSRPLARQPFDRPRAGGGQAVVDLGGLLGDVDVDRPGVAVGQAQQLARSTPAPRRAANGSPRRRRRCGRPQPRDARAAAPAPRRRRRRSGAGRRAAPAARSRRARTAPAAASGRCRLRRPRRPAPSASVSGSA